MARPERLSGVRAPAGSPVPLAAPTDPK